MFRHVRDLSFRDDLNTYETETLERSRPDSQLARIEQQQQQQQQQQQPTRCLKASGGPVWNLCEKFRFVGDLPGIIEFFFEDFGLLLLLLLQDGITALDKSIATAGENRKEGKYILVVILLELKAEGESGWELFI